MSTRVPLVAGNWKLHKTVAESVATVDELLAKLPVAGRTEVVVAPVFTALGAVAPRLVSARVQLAAQDVYWEAQGAFTGEVSAAQLRDVGCAFVIVGHSERRQYFGETDEHVAKKAKAALAEGLLPIVCVGEALETREAGDAESHVVAQTQAALGGLSDEELARVVVAYEPIWAIGTGRTASPKDAEQMHAAIRNAVAGSHGEARAEALRILYGGSVKPSNAAELMAQPNVDGALVGGASLEAESFAAIVAGAD